MECFFGTKGGSARLHFFLELGEELASQAVGGRTDQPAAELGDLAADIGLGRVAQYRCIAVFLQFDIRAALGETGNTAAALALQRKPLRSIRLSSVTLPPNFALTGPTFSVTLASSSVSEFLISSSQPGMHSFNDLRVVERGIDAVTRSFDPDFIFHFHVFVPQSSTTGAAVKHGLYHKISVRVFGIFVLAGNRREQKRISRAKELAQPSHHASPAFSAAARCLRRRS
jgi:hypothetical protein